MEAQKTMEEFCGLGSIVRHRERKAPQVGGGTKRSVERVTRGVGGTKR
jgi:hypothetical protein